MEPLGTVIVLLFLAFIKWWDWEHIDEASHSIGFWDSDTIRLNNAKKMKRVAELEEKVRKKNANNSGRRFYRKGPRIHEYTKEEIDRIDLVLSELELLNDPYPSHQKHFFIVDDEIVPASKEQIDQYKFKEKQEEINRENNPNIRCEFDHINRKLINSITKRIIDFDVDNYTLKAAVYAETPSSLTIN